MGSVTYDFLANSLLFDEDSLKNDFANESESRLEKELQSYREHCIKNYEELISEIHKTKSTLKVFSTTDSVPITLLKQTALYVDQFVVPDPIFKLTDKQDSLGETTSKYLGYSEGGLDRMKIKSSAYFLKNITPMVSGDFVKIFPLSYHFEAPKQVPFYIPENHNFNLLPKNLLDFFWNNVEVKSMIKADGGGWIIEKDLYPCRGIFIDFVASNYSHGMLYHLLESEVLDFDDANHKITFKDTLPDTPPDVDSFNAWVAQSVNSTSKYFYDQIFIENCLASSLECTYLTDNEFTSKLLTENFEQPESIKTFTANQLLKVELQFLNDIEVEKLMRIRTFDAEVFTTFRIELEKNFRELRTLNDEQIIKSKVENIFHELNVVQLNKINRKLSTLKKQFGVNLLIGVAGLVGTMHIGGISLLATATALGKGYKDYKQFINDVRENPAYFLWKIKK